MQETNIDFLRPFIVDGVLGRTSDLGKRIEDIFGKMRDNPASLTDDELKAAIEDKDSQIGDKEIFYNHCINTGGIFRQMVYILQIKSKDLDLPNPDVALAWGSVHDLSKIYAKYEGDFTQEDKELTLYFHARHLGLDEFAERVPMHSNYFEILEMIHEGNGFPKVHLYKEWTSVLNDQNNPFSFENIKKDFDLFLQGKSNLPLILLTIADYIEIGKSRFDLKTFDADFTFRMNDILKRYYTNKRLSGQEPSALGHALITRNGLDRAVLYKQIVLDLLRGDIEKYNPPEFSGLWKK